MMCGRHREHCFPNGVTWHCWQDSGDRRGEASVGRRVSIRKPRRGRNQGKRRNGTLLPHRTAKLILWHFDDRHWPIGGQERSLAMVLLLRCKKPEPPVSQLGQSRRFSLRRRLPVLPWKRASSGPVAMSQRCHELTCPPQTYGDPTKKITLKPLSALTSKR